MTDSRLLLLIFLAACHTNPTAGPAEAAPASPDRSAPVTVTHPGGAFLQILDLDWCQDTATSLHHATLRLNAIIHVQPRALNLPYDVYLTVSIVPDATGADGLGLWGTGGILNIARMTDDTVRVHLGSLQLSTNPVEFTLTVPYGKSGSLPARIRLTTHVEIIDPTSGAAVPYGPPLAGQLDAIAARNAVDSDEHDLGDLLLSVHAGQYATFASILESRAPKQEQSERLWIDLASTHDGYTTRWLELPRADRRGLPQRQLILLLDDGEKTRVELETAAGLELDLAAHLDLADERAIHAEQIEALPDGKLCITFPSLRALRLDPKDVTRLTLYELEPDADRAGDEWTAHFDDLRVGNGNKLH